MPLAPGASSGSGLKILFVVLACLAVAGVAAIGGLYYIGHKVKEAVVQKAAENGVDLSSITSPVSRANAPKPRIRKMCEYLSKEEVSRLIGEPVERAEVKDSICMYLGPAGLAARLAQEQGATTFKSMQAPGAKVNGMDVANAADQILSTMGTQSGVAGSNGEYPLLMLGIDPDGKAQMTALTVTNGLFGGMLHSIQAQDAKPGDKDCGTNCFGQNIPGLGDRALRLPKLELNILQGEILIRIIPGPLPDSDAKTIDIARAVLARI
jgi:hypothetical protein